MAWFHLPGEQVLAALIIGASTLTAAVIRAWVHLRADVSARRKNSRSYRPGPATVLVAVGVVGAGAVLLMGSRLPAPLLERLDVAGSFLHVPGAVANEAPDGPRALEDWLLADGLTLYYRHTRYLGDDCAGAVAVGNWAEGVADPVPVRCLEDGWLALDVAPLLRQGRMVRNLTYCVNFRAPDGAWGRHAALDAPGLDDVAVPANIIPLGHAIGFRIVHQAPVDRLILGDAFPRASC